MRDGAGTTVNNADFSGGKIGSVNHVMLFVGSNRKRLLPEVNALLIFARLQIVNRDTGVSLRNFRLTVHIPLGRHIDFTQRLINRYVGGTQLRVRHFFMQLDSLLDGESFGINNLQRSRIQRRYVEATAFGIQLHIHTRISRAIGPSKVNLLNNLVALQVKHSNAARTRYECFP